MFYQATEDYRIFEKEVPKTGSIEGHAQSSLSLRRPISLSLPFSPRQYLVVSTFTSGWRIVSFPSALLPLLLPLNSLTPVVVRGSIGEFSLLCRPETWSHEDLTGQELTRVKQSERSPTSSSHRLLRWRVGMGEGRTRTRGLGKYYAPGLLSGDEDLFLRFSRGLPRVSTKIPLPKTSTSLFRFSLHTLRLLFRVSLSSPPSQNRFPLENSVRSLHGYCG